jgi:hypothetical protein
MQDAYSTYLKIGRRKRSSFFSGSAPVVCLSLLFSVVIASLLAVGHLSKISGLSAANNNENLAGINR